MSAVGRQQTVARPARVRGTAIHSGETVTLTIRPAEVGHGLVLRRTDLRDKPTVPATIDHVVWSKLSNRTTLGRGEVEVQTPEHVLSALLALGVDNALIDVSASECPGVDNSALPFVSAIDRAGLTEQEEDREPLTLTEPITVRDDESGAEVTAIPSSHLMVTYFAEFPEGYFLQPQTIHLTVTPETFRKEIASARTWIFAEQIPGILLSGLGQGGTRESVLVIGRAEFVTEQRMDNEPVRHKAMDLIGDLALTGRPLLAHVMARRSGHALHAKLIRAIVDQTR